MYVFACVYMCIFIPVKNSVSRAVYTTIYWVGQINLDISEVTFAPSKSHFRASLWTSNASTDKSETWDE